MSRATPITLHTPLPDGTLLLEAMVASGGLGRLDEIELELQSDRADLAPQALLGRPVAVALRLRDDALRHFHGYVSRFGLAAHRGRRHGWRMTLRPWPWFLTRTQDCRIFQNQTVPEIVKTVFADQPLARYDFRLFRSYRARPYCVQYRESDWAFVARLLEQEGIYWYFEHAAAGHTMVLVDAASAHDAAPGCASLDYYEAPEQAPPDTDWVSAWRFVDEVQPGRTASTSYDFERPSADLTVQAARTRPHEQSVHEVFDFEGDWTAADDGTQRVATRLDEWQSLHALRSGSSNAQALATGRLLRLARHPREDQNVQHLVTGQRIELQQDVHESGLGGATRYRCDFTAIPAAQQFRPPCTTPRPFVHGPQTAVVVGPGGAEIHTDRYGRVKLKFHWDRAPGRDEHSSCWVRVSHPWAGRNFGAVHVPRIGQEVIVDFLEGDPDQPIVTGRIYNAEQMPPWELPGSATQSGVLSRSSPGGGYDKANAIRFEDKAGSEELWLHAEKDQRIEVEHDESHWVGHDRRKTVDHDETTEVKHDRTETVGHDETITVHGQRTETVDQDETITIHGARTETVDKDERITIHGARNEKVDHDETITIDGARTETVARDETITINGGRTEKVAHDESIAIAGGRTETVAKDEKLTISGGRTGHVAKDETLTVGGGRSTSVTKDEKLDVGAGRSVSVKNDDGLNVGKKLSATAGEQISLTTGKASIVLKSDGTIQISGQKITINGSDITTDGSGKITVKAGKEIAMKGSKITQN